MIELILFGAELFDITNLIGAAPNLNFDIVNLLQCRYEINATAQHLNITYRKVL